MTLVTDGVIQMKHLERVVPASKRPLHVIDEPSSLPPPPPPPPRDDFWDSYPKKEKKKKSKKAPINDEKRPGEEVAKIIEEPPICYDDPWAGWGSGGKKDKKENTRKTIESKWEPVVVSEPMCGPDCHDASSSFEPNKKDKEGANMQVPPPFHPPVEVEAPANDDAEPSDGWGSFQPKKGKKGKKAMSVETDLATAPKENEVGAPVAAPSGDEWHFWARPSTKLKKDKKKASIDDAPSIA
ncbi:MAG: hypothetical protein Q9184_008388 [Pyrenodesmia sp. 2 TL-2023]